MTPTTSELRLEVLARLHQLGRGHPHRVSVIARAGEPRSDGAVWNALDQLWAAGVIDHLGDDRYQLPTWSEEQLRLGGLG